MLATLGERTAFAGNILARNNITLESGASLSGEALALTGVVTLSGNDVSLCCKPITLAPATLADGKVCVPYGPTTITASGWLALKLVLVTVSSELFCPAIPGTGGLECTSTVLGSRKPGFDQ